MDRPDPPSPSALSVPLILGFYAAAAGLAWLLAAIFDVDSLWRTAPRPPGPLPEWAGIALGLALGLSAHGLGELARRRLQWARGFYDRLAELVGPLSTRLIVVAAVASALGEELLFRGALLPLLGLVPQALVFGVLHVGPGRAFRFWPVYAAVMGLALGGLYVVTGSLLGPILAHFTVNLFGLATVARQARPSD